MRSILHVYPSFEIGGSQRRFAQVCKHLGDRYHHTIVSLDDRWDALTLLPDGVSYEKLFLTPGVSSTLKTMSAARRVLLDQHPDILVTYNWGAIEWGAANLLPICPHVHIEDGFRPDEVDKRIGRRNLFRRLVLRSNSRLIVISETLLKIALEEWKIPAKRVQFIPNGIDVDKYAGATRTSTARPQGLNPDDIVIGTVAALRPEKDIAALIDIFARLERNGNTKLMICGDGPERANLETQARSLNIDENVIFTGYTDKPEEALAHMDIFALSSRTEQMPLSVLEAMAARLPIAGYAVGDVANMVSSDNTPYVVKRDQKQLLDTLNALLGDQDLRDKVGSSNYERVRSEYSENGMYKAYEDLFNAAR